MGFNYDKCKVMHLKKNNNTKKTSLTQLEFSYTMGTQDSMERHILEITSIERDLGIRLTNNLKWSTHVKYAANKAIVF